ncbi:MAG: hypothetical protein HYX25_07110 [Candidatus Solibacter usitatus]|nr:hypothetical protein [Candidatus Solibacter usitatus]
MRKIALMVVLTVAGLLAQGSESFTTFTGRVWTKSMSLQQKLMFTEGIKEGMLIATSYLDGNERHRVLEEVQAKGFSPRDYVKELDALYLDRQNLPIPITTAYMWVNLKLKGEVSKQELERKLLELRKQVPKSQV